MPLLGVTLGACGTTTIDPKSGEDLFRNYVKERAPTITVKSVSCPSGIKPKTGATFNCKIAVLDKSTGAKQSGTVTVHVTNGGKQVEMGSQDIHLQ